MKSLKNMSLLAKALKRVEAKNVSGELKSMHAQWLR